MSDLTSRPNPSGKQKMDQAGRAKTEPAREVKKFGFYTTAIISYAHLKITSRASSTAIRAARLIFYRKVFLSSPTPLRDSQAYLFDQSVRVMSKSLSTFEVMFKFKVKTKTTGLLQPNPKITSLRKSTMYSYRKQIKSEPGI